MPRSLFKAALLACACTLIATTSGGVGCGASPTEGKHEDRPDWVDRGGQVMKDKAAYGVGVASNISSVGLRRSTADAQARAELAKQFSSRVQNLIKNYEASTNDGDKEAAEAHRQEATKIFTEMDLPGVVVVDRFFDTDQNTEYALARLDPADFAAQLEQMEKLSARTKEIIKANAAKAFGEIDDASAERKADKQ